MILLSLLSLGTFGLVFFLYLHKRTSKSKSPLSSAGAVHTTLCPSGSVFVDGELWLAQSFDGSTILQKTQIIVVGIRNHLLLVSRLSDEL